MTYGYSLLVQNEIGTSPGAGAAWATLGAQPAGPEGELLVAEAAGISRHDPRTGAWNELLAPYPYYGLGTAGITLGPDGRLYASSGQKVLRVDPWTGAYLGAFVLSGSGGLYQPRGLAFGPDGNLYVASFISRQILRYDGHTGAFMDVFVPKEKGGLEYPTDLRFSPGGTLFVACGGSILRFDGRTGAPLGGLQGLAASAPAGVGGLTFGPDGKLYVTSIGTHAVLRFNPVTGSLLDTFVAPGSGGLNTPTGLSFGLDGNLYVISKGTHNVLRYDGRTGAFRGALFAGDPTALLFLPAAPPPAPTGLVATLLPALAGAPARVDLTWADAPSPGQKAVAIWRKDASGAWQRVGVVAPGVTTFADPDIRPGTPYTYRVRATTDTLASGWSNEAGVTPAAAPAAPAGLSAQAVSPGEIDLTWNSDGGNETGVAIFRKAGDPLGAGDWQRLAVVPPRVTQYRDRTVQPGTTYVYRMRTHNDQFASGWTSDVSVSTPAHP